MDPETKIDEPATGSRRSLGDFLARIGLILLFILLICGSLMTFPGGLPWVILLWLAIGGIFVLRNLSPACLLIMLVALVAIKNPEWSVMLLALMIACCATVALCFGRRGTERQIRWPVVLLLVLWAVFFVDFRLAATRSTQATTSDATAIACLGDSLTDCGYPQELQKLIHNPVLDYGFDGITSADGLELVDEILAKNPRQLVLELGGHDFNQGRSRQETLINLSLIIQQCRDNQVDVLLVEIPRGFVRDPFRGIERQLARQFDLELISDTLIRQFVLYSPVCPPGAWLPTDQHLSRDGLHPNDNGNQLFAQSVASKLAKLLGDEILIDRD